MTRGGTLSAYTVLDLFSGCGGMSWALHKAGFRIVAGIDEWGAALETFRWNHPEALIINGDIREHPPESVRQRLGMARGELDVLVGGPPCQGFSKNVPASYRFLEDERNQLYNEFLHYAEEFQPRVVVMENVAELYNAYSGSVRDDILGRLEAMGYSAEAAVLFGPDYGIPQRRRRCFFFASRTEEPAVFPRVTHARHDASEANQLDILPSTRRNYWSAWDAISDLPALENGEGHEPMPYCGPPKNDLQQDLRSGAEFLFDHVTRPLRSKQMARVSSIGPGQGLKDLPPELRPRSGYSGAYGRLDFVSVAPTITRWVFHPGSGRYCHPSQARLITIREAARLQTFSDDFRFVGKYIEKAHQVGNAVPPFFMKALLPSILRCLTSTHQRAAAG